MIKKYVELFNLMKSNKSCRFNKTIIDKLADLKIEAIKEDNQDIAKKIWILETICSINNGYMDAFQGLYSKNYFQAWNTFNQIDIKISFLVKHFDITSNDFQIQLISDQVHKFQELFPYVHFFSREAIVKKRICSICKQERSIWENCQHVVGDIYNGELCGSEVMDLEVIGFVIVENPFDKYAVLMPAKEEMEYNYKGLEMLMSELNDPFEKWDISTVLETKPEYKNIGRNDICPCNSNQKYKNCCLKSGKDKFPHKRILFNRKISNKPLEIVNTWV